MADEYQWDTIEAYRFTKDIIDNYLKGLFGNWDYFTELCLDKYQFWVPRKLTEAERRSLLLLRLPDTKKST